MIFIFIFHPNKWTINRRIFKSFFSLVLSNKNKNIDCKIESIFIIFWNSISITSQNEWYRQPWSFSHLIIWKKKVFLIRKSSLYEYNMRKDRVTLLVVFYFITFFKSLISFLFFLIKQLNLFLNFECTHTIYLIKINRNKKGMKKEATHKKKTWVCFLSSWFRFCST